MTKYIFDTDEIEFRFSSKQIKHYMRENHYPNCNIMLKNPEDFNTSDENVKGDDR